MRTLVVSQHLLSPAVHDGFRAGAELLAYLAREHTIALIAMAARERLRGAA